MMHLITSSILLSCLVQILSAYEIPNATFVVHRKGFDVSIPYEDGMELLMFSANINSELQLNAISTLFGMANVPDNSGCLTYRDLHTELKLGDTLYYRLYVRKGVEKYVKDHLVYTVNSYETESEPSQSEVPDVNFKIFRKGFEVSLRHEDDIEVFTFTANLNLELQLHKIGSLFGYAINPDENGYLKYRDTDSALKLGDNLHYRVCVRRNGVDYYKHNLVYTVRGYEAEPGVDASSPYRIPDPNFKIYRRGFEITLPYEHGIQTFLFRANINSKLKSNRIPNLLGIGFERDGNGDMIYKNVDAELKLGDILHYRITVRKDIRTYVRHNLVYTVTGYEGISAVAEPSPYEIPNPSFKIYRKGFEVAIPYEVGIEIFIITANLNQELQENEIGSLYGFASGPDENGGYLTYRNMDSELNLGDIIHYSICVQKSEAAYYIHNLVYTVTSYETESESAETSQHTIPMPGFKA